MAQENQQQDHADEELVLINDQVRIGLSNFRIALEKKQPYLIYRLCLAILKQYSFFNAFTKTDDVPKIYIFVVGADLLRDALQITPKVPDQPFVEPPPLEDLVSFIKKLGYTGSFN
ncbi:hypothetical protein Tco_0074182 [Tanacetum coccineum]